MRREGKGMTMFKVSVIVVEDLEPDSVLQLGQLVPKCISLGFGTFGSNTPIGVASHCIGNDLRARFELVVRERSFHDHLAAPAQPRSLIGLTINEEASTRRLMPTKEVRLPSESRTLDHGYYLCLRISTSSRPRHLILTCGRDKSLRM
jgi:hypothetical protein